MPRIKRELVIDGTACRVTEACIDCKYFNPEAKESFRCACMGTCPGVTYSEKYKAWLLKRYSEGHGHFVETEIMTEDDVASTMTKQMADHIDAQILKDMANGKKL